jgi:hypothetical protein
VKKRYLILLLLLSTISITSCKTVPTTVRYYDIIPPPTRPKLVQVMDEPIRGLTHNLSLLITHVERWEAWYKQLKAYDSL